MTPIAYKIAGIFQQEQTPLGICVNLLRRQPTPEHNLRILSTLSAIDLERLCRCASIEFSSKKKAIEKLDGMRERMLGGYIVRGGHDGNDGKDIDPRTNPETPVEEFQALIEESNEGMTEIADTLNALESREDIIVALSWRKIQNLDLRRFCRAAFIPEGKNRKETIEAIAKRRWSYRGRSRSLIDLEKGGNA